MAELHEARKRLFQALRGELGDDRAIAAMEQVPREDFLPEASRHMAYDDIPLPIGEGQTISQPFIIAMMVQMLELNGEEKVLEIGTGSGYQAAVLARLARRVITVERIPYLAESASQRLTSLGYTNVCVCLAGETLGWPQETPYDGIIVAAGAPKLPRVLLEQLGPRGRLVMPIGSLQEQELWKVTRTEKGYSIRTMGACRFVPLIGKGAWPEQGP